MSLFVQAAKDYQNQAVRQSRPEEKDYSGYHTVHNLEIPNLSVTVSGLVHLPLRSFDRWSAFRHLPVHICRSRARRWIY